MLTQRSDDLFIIAVIFVAYMHLYIQDKPCDKHKRLFYNPSGIKKIPFLIHHLELLPELYILI